MLLAGHATSFVSARSFHCISTAGLMWLDGELAASKGTRDRNRVYRTALEPYSNAAERTGMNEVASNPLHAGTMFARPRTFLRTLRRSNDERNDRKARADAELSLPWNAGIPRLGIFAPLL